MSFLKTLISIKNTLCLDWRDRGSYKGEFKIAPICLCYLQITYLPIPLSLEKIKVVSSINPLRDWVLTLVGPRYPLPAVKGDIMDGGRRYVTEI